ncbi:MAG TPA: UDP-3-O-acyl-N-acetylglucosamine deacetylase, partial [Chitinophagaceae bacterium]|nr:UDP-3-O-acyl-N-acetylglucosamine deacetylase [Chitinophagaceae bacterium]
MEKMTGNGQLFQTTIKHPITISGMGIHTGVSVSMTLEPAEPNTGIVFQRVDLPGQPTVKADCDFVTETRRSTTIEHNGAKVSTIEHLLAAFVGSEVDNVLVKIDGAEVPILDGSSKPFVEVLEKIGVEK